MSSPDDQSKPHQRFERLHLVPLDPDALVRPQTYSRSPRRVRPQKAIAIALAALTSMLLVYNVLWASPQYESIASFVVRSPQTSIPGPLTDIVQVPKLVRSLEDAYIAKAFLESPDGLAVLAKEARLSEIFSRPEADVFSRYPGLISGESEERLFKFARSMISVQVNKKTGVTEIRAFAFRPKDAKAIVEAMIRIAEERVNRLVTRSQTDAVAAAEEAVLRNRESVRVAQEQLEKFRQKSGIVDPKLTSKADKKKFAKLALEAAELRVQVTAVARSAPASPQAEVLARRLEAIEAQSASENARLAGSDATLGGQTGTYERLMLESELAEKALILADATLQMSNIKRLSQQYFLDVIALPSEPDFPSYPRRLVMAGLLLLVALAIGRSIS